MGKEENDIRVAMVCLADHARHWHNRRSRNDKRSIKEGGRVSLSEATSCTIPKDCHVSSSKTSVSCTIPLADPSVFDRVEHHDQRPSYSEHILARTWLRRQRSLSQIHQPSSEKSKPWDGDLAFVLGVTIAKSSAHGLRKISTNTKENWFVQPVSPWSCPLVYTERSRSALLPY